MQEYLSGVCKCFYIKVSTDTEHHTVLTIRYLAMPHAAEYEVIYAAVILIAVYVLIGFDVSVQLILIFYRTSNVNMLQVRLAKYEQSERTLRQR